MGEVDPICVYERLLDDDDLKDVTIEFSDGTLRAHSCVLSSASEAVKGILRNGTARESKTLTWREHDLKVGRFFLRLLYTGCVEERDWSEQAPAAGGPGTGTAATSDGAAAGTTAGATTGSTVGTTALTTSGAGRLNGSPPPLHDGHRVRVVRDTNALVMGGSCRFIASGTLGTVSGGGKTVMLPSTLGGAVFMDSLQGNLEAIDPRPPLCLLTGGIAIAKVYQFPTLLGALTASIKRRLSPHTFDEICRAAIHDDIQVLRYHCMRFVDSESQEARQLRELHSEGRLSPEVMHELDGLWRQEPCKPSKRRRLL
uniref:BTB domain-containing protein n=1 Tax=Alexandrium monilatum TaxID=311494 RepID=A0A7S4UYP6_9DINO|mmetsp:Transcript_30227/g.89624  ORF Transcript_30227/g.89624 Transcript_30227/m.89624 type:complete len:313 (+) Transcript_30227:78-1016(+)